MVFAPLHFMDSVHTSEHEPWGSMDAENARGGTTDEEVSAANCFAVSDSVKPWLALLPAEGFGMFCLVVARAVHNLSEETGSPTWRLKPRQPAWFSILFDGLLAKDEGARLRLLHLVVDLNVGSQLSTGASPMRAMLHAATHAEVDSLFANAVDFFAHAADNSAGSGTFSFQTLSSHCRRQGIVASVPDSFFSNTLVFSSANGRKGTIHSRELDAYNVTNIQSVPNCRCVSGDCNEMLAILALEKMGHPHISSCCVVKVPDPGTGVSIPSMRIPTVQEPSSKHPMLFITSDPMGSAPSADLSMCCSQENLLIDVEIHRAGNLQVNVNYTCQANYRVIVATDSILNDAMVYNWHIRRVSRRADTISSIGMMRAVMLGMTSEALMAKQGLRAKSAGL